MDIAQLPVNKTLSIIRHILFTTAIRKSGLYLLKKAEGTE